MASNKEGKVQSNIIKLIKRRGGYVYKNAASVYTVPGLPDLSACIPVKLKRLIELYGEDATVGLFLGIEVKDKGKLDNVSKAQEIVGIEMMKSSALWLAADNEDIIEKLLNKLEV